MADNSNERLTNFLNEEKTMKDKFFDSFKSNFNYLIVAVISVGFISSCYIQLNPNGDIVSIIAQSCIGVLVGWLIKTLLGRQGMLNGFASSKVVKLQDNYDEIVKTNSKDSEYYLPFCDIENEEKVREFQTQLLSAVNLKYAKFIKGDYDGTNSWTNIKGQEVPFTKIQKRVLNQCRHPRINFISPEYLTNESSVASIREQKEVSVKKYEGLRNSQTFITMSVNAIIFGYFTASVAGGNTLANLIWTALQVMVYLAWGFYEYWKRYSWVTTDHFSYIRKRYDLLIKFRQMLDNKNVLLLDRTRAMQEELLINEVKKEDIKEQEIMEEK